MLAEYYNESDTIRLRPIIRTKEEAIIIANKLNTTVYDTLSDLKWHCINGKYYRFKFFDRLYPILNELIGPKIAQHLNLKTANNFSATLDLGDDRTLYGIASESFIEPDKKYLTMFDLGFSNKTIPEYKNLKRLKRYCNNEDYPGLLNNIFKMTCTDYIMGQVDRVSSNFLFEKDGEKISLAPLFDYAEAYEYAKMGCYFNQRENKSQKISVGNSLITPIFWEPNFQRRLKKYPQFREYLDKVCQIDIVKIIEEIEEEQKLNVPDEYKRYYDVRTKEKQKILY